MEKQQLICEAKNLSLHLRESREYQAYTAARETAFANDTTKALIEQYHRCSSRPRGTCSPAARQRTRLWKN